jgi:hypothetical protein
MTKDKNKNNKIKHDPNKPSNNGLPNYRIMLMSGKLFGPADFYSTFDMYINKREIIDAKNKHESIEGIIGTELKIAEFKGEISDKFIDITLNYNSAAEYYGLKKGKVICRGSYIRDAYLGCFGYAENDTIEPEFSNENRFGIKEFDSEKICYSMPIMKNKPNIMVN